MHFFISETLINVLDFFPKPQWVAPADAVQRKTSDSELFRNNLSVFCGDRMIALLFDSNIVI